MLGAKPKKTEKSFMPSLEISSYTVYCFSKTVILLKIRKKTEMVKKVRGFFGLAPRPCL